MKPPIKMVQKKVFGKTSKFAFLLFILAYLAAKTVPKTIKKAQEQSVIDSIPKKPLKKLGI